MRIAATLVAVVLLAATACLLPTEGCACPPARSAAVVAGRLTDSNAMPVVGAHIGFDGVPPTMSSEPPMFIDEPGVTDAEGRFVVRAYAMHYPGELALRAAVVRAGSTDTVRFRTGAVGIFRLSTEPLDTVRVEVMLPE